MTWISKLTSMAKRLENMRSDGVDFDITVKVSVFTARATLLQVSEMAELRSGTTCIFCLIMPATIVGSPLILPKLWDANAYQTGGGT